MHDSAMETKTLPFSWYGDPDVLRLEQELIFRHAWQYVGHSGQLAEPGDRFPAQAGDVPVLLVRGEDRVRAFLNVCRHRGSRLVEEPGRQAAIQCPYHAWTYALDGSLRAAPRSEREAGFDADGLSLVELRLERWGPFLFVSADPDAPPLMDILGPLAGLVQLDGLEFRLRDEFELAANWKIACENYLECYHCPVAHKGFSAAFDVAPDSYRLEATSEHVLSQYAPVSGTGVSDTAEGHFHFVWPNLRVNIYPGPANLSIGPLLPAGPERSTGFLDYFFAAGADEEWVTELLAFDRQVGEEDRALVERVQRGVGSGLIEHGRLLPESEQLVAGFQARVRETLAR
jgi:phenylpropionate dioxygenase-like ring-hydroxylating dioxygenase large terminal subunit